MGCSSSKSETLKPVVRSAKSLEAGKIKNKNEPQNIESKEKILLQSDANSASRKAQITAQSEKSDEKKEKVKPTPKVQMQTQKIATPLAGSAIRSVTITTAAKSQGGTTQTAQKPSNTTTYSSSTYVADYSTPSTHSGSRHHNSGHTHQSSSSSHHHSSSSSNHQSSGHSYGGGSHSYSSGHDHGGYSGGCDYGSHHH